MPVTDTIDCLSKYCHTEIVSNRRSIAEHQGLATNDGSLVTAILQRFKLVHYGVSLPMLLIRPSVCGGTTTHQYHSSAHYGKVRSRLTLH